mmetsp:Transcript_51496/g.137429  ORF Transcript_51496/g.137429 Transcript_51496/m.137429 type:complete len:249 (-) Transcript_51496:48-794(-)
MLAQNLHWCGHFFLHDLLVLLFLRICLQTLPGETSSVEVHQHVPNSLQIIPPTLLDTQMRVDTGISSCASQILAFPVRNVLLCLWVPVLFGKTKIDYVHLVRLLAETDQEVVGLDVAVNEILCMHVLHAIDHLIRQHQDRLKTELPVAETEQVFQRRPEKIDDHDVIVPLHTIPVDVWDPDPACQDFVKFRLVQKLGMFRLDGFELDCDLLSSLNVGADVNIAERSRSDFASKSEFSTNTELHGQKGG